MEIFGLALIICAIFFWKHILMGLVGAAIFGLIGSIFGETGGVIGAVIGFFSGISAAKEELKKEQDFASRSEREPNTPGSSTKESNNKPSSSDRIAQVIHCPGCARKIRVTLPIKGPNAKCLGCSAQFELCVDPSGKVQVKSKNEQERQRKEKQQKAKPNGGQPAADYYTILGCRSSATPDDVRAAYRKKIGEYHPDRVANLGEKLQEIAIEESQRINNAYSTLKARGLAS